MYICIFVCTCMYTKRTAQPQNNVAASSELRLQVSETWRHKKTNLDFESWADLDVKWGSFRTRHTRVTRATRPVDAGDPRTCCFSWRHRSRKSSRLSFICKQKPVGVDVNSCWSRENQTALACNLFTFPCVHLKWKRSELKFDEGRYCAVFNVCEMMTNRAIDSCFHDLVVRRNVVKTRLPLVAVVFCALYSSCTASNTRTRQERSEKLSQSVTQNQQVWITRLEQKHVALNVHVNRANTTVTSCSGNYAEIKFRLSTVCTRKEPVHSWARGIDRVQRAL